MKTLDATVRVRNQAVPFRTEVKPLKNNHRFQFFVDYGNETGPWFSVGLQDTQYSVGYLPTKTKETQNANTIKPNRNHSSKVSSNSTQSRH